MKLEYHLTQAEVQKALIDYAIKSDRDTFGKKVLDSIKVEYNIHPDDLHLIEAVITIPDVT